MTKRAKPGPRSRERTDRIIDAAYRAMVRSGLSGLRTRDIAAEAGITVATLHYYFPTKHDVTQAVLHHLIEQRMLAPLRLDNEWGDGLAALRTMLTGLRHQAETNPGHFRLLHEMIWAAREDEWMSRTLAAWHDGWLDSMTGWFANGQRDGRVRADADPRTVATLVMYLVLGLVMRPPMSGDDAGAAAEFERLISSITDGEN